MLLSEHTFVIAEVGPNHNGNLALAHQLIDVAKRCGADAVKFQAGVPELVSTSWAPVAEYQEREGRANSQIELNRAICFALDDLARLAAYCKQVDIPFLCSTFDPVSTEFLVQLGQTTWKIASGELTNIVLLRAIAPHAKQVILSTGMSTMDEVKAAIQILEDAGLDRQKIAVLHCLSQYPAPLEDLNLRAMNTMANELGCTVGYSDHTLGSTAAIAAVAMGARIIEKHFTMDRSLPGPDHQASLEPAELASMIVAIREVEKMRGDGRKRPMPSEESTRSVARRSIVAAGAIEAGEILTEDKLCCKRPGTGLSPMLWDEVVGTPAVRSFDADELIEL
jgi:N,N'-diacetyllegionaminate synthase